MGTGWRAAFIRFSWLAVSSAPRRSRRDALQRMNATGRVFLSPGDHPIVLGEVKELTLFGESAQNLKENHGALVVDVDQRVVEENRHRLVRVAQQVDNAGAEE